MQNVLAYGTRKSIKNISNIYLDLRKNAGPIPKGIYKVVERTRNGFVCECGRKILFGLESLSKEYFEVVKDQEITSLTSVEEFIVKYWILMDEISRKPVWKLWTDDPKTFCLIDPSLEFHA